jgi:hypothetical protein
MARAIVPCVCPEHGGELAARLGPVMLNGEIRQQGLGLPGHEVHLFAIRPQGLETAEHVDSEHSIHGD